MREPFRACASGSFYIRIEKPFNGRCRSFCDAVPETGIVRRHPIPIDVDQGRKAAEQVLILIPALGETVIRLAHGCDLQFREAHPGGADLTGFAQWQPQAVNGKGIRGWSDAQIDVGTSRKRAVLSPVSLPVAASVAVEL